ncbi:MAG: hypothetical protein WC319_09005 [Candidatus Paceibacterota bacterium]|jgi:hypothetical protein
MRDEKLENSIMGKIKSGQVKLKSKYAFLAEKLGLGTAFTFSVLLSILFFNLILFYLKETDNLKYLSFGKFGIFAFLESFPYLLVIVFIILIVFSGYLLTRSDVSYKKPFGYLAIGMIAIIMILGGILTYTNLGQSFEREARRGNESVRVFFKPLINDHNNGVAGVVFEQNENYLILQTPQGMRRVEIEEVEDIPSIKKDQFVIAVGFGEKSSFKATKIMIADKGEMPSIRRGIDFKFGEFDRKNIPPELLNFTEEEKSCIKKCFDLKKSPRECFEECHEE